MRPQPESAGTMSLTLVSQSNLSTPGGKAVVLRLDAKSSIKIPKAVAVKALDTDAK